MAAAPSMQTPAGNPEFVRLDSKYRCQKCQDVVREAMQTPCGHRLCQNCVNEMFVDEEMKVQCPANDEDCTEMTKNEIYPDYGGRKEVRKLSVYCTYKQYGCPKELQWRSLEKHEKECDFVPVDCHNKEYGCTQKISKSKLSSHVAECNYRLVPCEHCRQSGPAIAMEDHLKTACPAIEVECPNNCGSPAMRRQELGSHIETCPNRQYKCKFEVTGCNFIGTEKAMKEHQLNDVSQHLERLTIYSTNMEVHNLETERKLQEVTSEKDKLQQLVMNLQQESTRNRTENRALKEAIKNLKRKMVGLTKRITRESLERRSEGQSAREIVTKHDNDIAGVQTSITALRTQITQLERQQGEAACGGGAVANPAEFEDMKQRFVHLDVQLAELDLCI